MYLVTRLRPVSSRSAIVEYWSEFSSIGGDWITEPWVGTRYLNREAAERAALRAWYRMPPMVIRVVSVA